MMHKVDTKGTLFDLALDAEKAGMDLYLNLVKRFVHMPDVAEFWQGMLNDKIQHATELERIRSSLNAELLQNPAEEEHIQKARKAHDFQMHDKLQSVENLDDAYKLAGEFEHSEVNTVFRLIMDEFLDDERKRKFALAELRLHLAKLADFSSRFGDAEWRKKTEVRRP
jgi:hypothetical protein